MICPHWQAINNGFGCSPTTTLHAGAQQQERVHNGESHKRTHNQDEKSIEKGVGGDVGGSEGDPEAAVIGMDLSMLS